MASTTDLISPAYKLSPDGFSGFGYLQFSGVLFCFCFLWFRRVPVNRNTFCFRVVLFSFGFSPFRALVLGFYREEKDDMAKVDSDKFKTIIQEVDSLYQLVQKPREQVADAEALLDITNILPMETYKADLSISLDKHHKPVTFLDKVAYYTVKALRWPTDLFFQTRYGCRAMMLETVAAVPGMVGGMLSISL